MEKLNATFEGEKMTLARVWEYLQATRSSNGLSIFVTKESGPDLAEQIHRRDCYPDHDELIGIPLPIIGTYGYGFDVSIGDSSYEIDCEEGENGISVFLLRSGTFAISDEPPAVPIPEKLKVRSDINVSVLSMDELADIVSTYDEIHADAIKELNNRLDTFRDKL